MRKQNYLLGKKILFLSRFLFTKVCSYLGALCKIKKHMVVVIDILNLLIKSTTLVEDFYHVVFSSTNY